MSPRPKLTPEQKRDANALREKRFRGVRADFMTRNCAEFILSVVLVGFLPLILHSVVFLFFPQKNDGRWVPAEAWIFVMVTSAAIFGDAWKNRRRHDGTLALGASVFGGCGVAAGAFGYAIISVNPTSAAVITQWFTRGVWWSGAIVAIVFLVVRVPDLWENASADARTKLAIKG